MIAGILIPLIFIAISSYIIWKSTDSFETAADYLGRKMTDGVKGATINAIASSMPEFLTTMFFLFYIKNEGNFADSFSGGLGVTAGSAVFNILIIPFAILFLSTVKGRIVSFPVDREVIKRDGIFLLLANIILIFIIRQKQLDVKDGLTLIILYLLYLFFLRKGFGKNTDFYEENVHMIPHNDIKFKDIIKIDLNKLLLGGKLLNTGLAWKVLIISTLVMSMGTWLLVEGTELLGRKEYSIFGIDGLRGLGVPLIFLSVVFASAATSIPDTMISLRDARKNNHIDSISNAIGSNIFDISFALGLPLFLYTIIYRPVVMSEEVRVWSLSVWLVLLIINLIVVPLFFQSKNFGRSKGIILFLLYLAFIFFIIEENTRLSWVSGFVRGLLE